MGTTTAGTAFSQHSTPSPIRHMIDADVRDVPINVSRLFNGGLYKGGSNSQNVNVIESPHADYDSAGTDNDSPFSPVISSTPFNSFPMYTLNASQSHTLWEQNELFARNMIPVMVFVGLLMTIGLPGNCLVVYVYGFRFKSATQNVLIVCLACLDLVICLVAMPSEIADMRFHHTFGSEFACKVLRFITMFVSIASCMTLISVAYDRHKRITKPLSRQMTPRAAKTWVVFNLVAALLISWPTFLMTGLRPSVTKIAGLYGKDCSYTEQFADTVYPLLFNCVLALGFLLSIGILSIFYFRIWKAARSRKINMAKRYTITSLSDSSHFDFKGDMVADTPREFLRLLRKHPSIDNTNLAFHHNINPSNTTVFSNESPACNISTLARARRNEDSQVCTGNDVVKAKDPNESFGVKNDGDESHGYESCINKAENEPRFYDEKEGDDYEIDKNQMQKTCLHHSDPDLLALAKHSDFQMASHESYHISVSNIFFAPSLSNVSTHLYHTQSSCRNSSNFTVCTFCKNCDGQHTSPSIHNDSQRRHISRQNNDTFNASFSSESDFPDASFTDEINNQATTHLSTSRGSFNFDEPEYSLPSCKPQTNSCGNSDDTENYLELDVLQLSEKAPVDVLPCSKDFCQTSCEIRDFPSANGLYAYDAEITIDEEDRRVSVDFILESFSHLIGPPIKPMDLPPSVRYEQSQSPHESKANFTTKENSTVSVAPREGKSCLMMEGINEREDFEDTDRSERDNESKHSRLSRISEDFSLGSQSTHFTSLSSHSIHEDSKTPKREQDSRTRCHSGSSRAELNLSCLPAAKKRTFFIGSLDKTTVVALAVSCVFILSFLPYLILMSIRALDSSFYTNLDWTSLWVFQLFLRFYFLNSSSNPILYGLLNTNFRRECCAIWRSLIGCCSEKVKVDRT